MRVPDQGGMLRVHIRPRALLRADVLDIIPGANVVAAINMAADAAAIENSVETLRWSLEDSTARCVVLLLNLGTAPHVGDVGSDFTRRLCRLIPTVRVVMCGTFPPSWRDIASGLLEYTDGYHVPLPWLDRRRIALLRCEAEAERWLEPEGTDAPGDMVTATGGPPGWADCLDSPPPVCLTVDGRRAPLTLQGIPGCCGVWMLCTATGADLVNAVARVRGGEHRWRFTVQGGPLADHVLLQSLHGSVIWAIPVVRGGMRRSDTPPFAFSQMPAELEYSQRGGTESPSQTAAGAKRRLHKKTSAAGSSTTPDRKKVRDHEESKTGAAGSMHAPFQPSPMFEDVNAVGGATPSGASTPRRDWTDGLVDDIEIFFENITQAVAVHADVEEDLGDEDGGIPQRVESIRARVAAAYPAWTEEQKRLAAGVLCMESFRPQGVTILEEVFLLYLITSPNRLRAHNGTAYVYDSSGSWMPYTGVMPPVVLFEVKVFLMQVEGFYRTISSNTERSEQGILQCIHSTFQRAGRPPAEVLKGFMRLSQTYIQRRGQRRARPAAAPPGPAEAAAGGSDEEVAQEIPDTGSWTETIAFITMRAGSSMTVAMLGDRLMKHYVEWCETEKPTRSAASFLDTCIVFDEAGVAATHVQKGPEQNVYIFIRQKMLHKVARTQENGPDADGVAPTPCIAKYRMVDNGLAAAMERVQRFLQETFWQNGKALQCNLAAMSLAIRGHNLDRCFWGIGPGGVGQSLFSAHLAAILGRLHAYLDTNVYYTDDELRKQACVSRELHARGRGWGRVGCCTL